MEQKKLVSSVEDNKNKEISLKVAKFCSFLKQKKGSGQAHKSSRVVEEETI